ncbi:condensation domain-containing protein [Luteimonas panaciterrae]|uniref:condensation domain-containing protein n=1 Tax=Luteimonas panaciterrae TaxID=363885 RepID=UPI001CF98040|nr:condensation domain-containing protein [Luteimonas panaciterrae]
MKRKLSTIERLIDGNLCWRIALEGNLTAEKLRASLDRMQRKHPALRMLIHEANGEFFYELDAARQIPLRVVEWVSAEHRTHECETEAYAAFPHDQPQLRVVWLRRPHDNTPGVHDELLITSAHRICDGMSMFVIVRELLEGLHSDQALTPYTALDIQDVIGDFHDKHAWKRKLLARAINSLFSLIPSSRRPLVNREVRLEWGVSHDVSERLKRRCKTEGVPLHAAMLVALGEALPVLGKQAPDWIESPIDARRGRLPALKDDMLFFGGGAFKIASRQDLRRDFWVRARETAEDMRRKIDQDIADIPGKYQFCEMLKPPSAGKIRSIVRLGDAVGRNGSWNRILLSNLGNVSLDDAASPLQVKDFTTYVHSFTMRTLGILAHSLHGQLRFVYLGDEMCLRREQAEALGHAFTASLDKCTADGDVVQLASPPQRAHAVSTTNTPTLGLASGHREHAKSPELLS